ncbi:hypothetical protein [Rhizobium alvei]|uniref:Uncharacterized protein n=1 Tax=Rhizobium alvei TaxID=1132659 RepID=A0ABT8YHU1_9HYPH|nr:hypothetical protein [Rhizobium alvei]MDO6963253.1 hypothetical protein [Rhizobium alvei]
MKTTLKTSTIVALSMAFGIVAGAGVTAIAANQPNMRSALDHLTAADAFLAKASDNKGGHRVKARQLISLAIAEVKAGIRFAN